MFVFKFEFLSSSWDMMIHIHHSTLIRDGTTFGLGALPPHLFFQKKLLVLFFKNFLQSNAKKV